MCFGYMEPPSSCQIHAFFSSQQVCILYDYLLNLSSKNCATHTVWSIWPSFGVVSLPTSLLTHNKTNSPFYLAFS